MAVITVDLYPEQEPFRKDLEFFIQVMIRKLHMNRHKGYAEGVSISWLMSATAKEMDELADAVATKDQMAAVVEAADIANMAFLVAHKAMSMERPRYDEEKGKK